VKLQWRMYTSRKLSIGLTVCIVEFGMHCPPDIGLTPREKLASQTYLFSNVPFSERISGSFYRTSPCEPGISGPARYNNCHCGFGFCRGRRTSFEGSGTAYPGTRCCTLDRTCNWSPSWVVFTLHCLHQWQVLRQCRHYSKKGHPRCPCDGRIGGVPPTRPATAVTNKRRFTSRTHSTLRSVRHPPRPSQWRQHGCHSRRCAHTAQTASLRHNHLARMDQADILGHRPMEVPPMVACCSVCGTPKGKSTTAKHLGVHPKRTTMRFSETPTLPRPTLRGATLSTRSLCRPIATVTVSTVVFTQAGTCVCVWRVCVLSTVFLGCLCLLDVPTIACVSPSTTCNHALRSLLILSR
jgi:hypothetical protein